MTDPIVGTGDAPGRLSTATTEQTASIEADTVRSLDPRPARPRRSPGLALRRTAGGIGAVGVKELRGRMRGRRAFVILTIYLLLLAGFAWMVELIAEQSFSNSFGAPSSFATAAIGQGIFAALLFLETLQVAFLAPAATAGSVSLEREKQTLELLIVTPISSLALVLGKLLSALIYVWLLIAASIPLTAVVFVYGGVAPEDILRGYIVLVVTALGLGSFGLVASSLVKRTQAATAISVFTVLFVSIGTIFLLIFWGALANDDNGAGRGPIKGQAPQVIAYLNPFLAQADVLCGTESSSGGWCSIVQSVFPDPNGVVFTDTTGGVVGPVPAGPVAVDANGNPISLPVAPPGGVVNAPQFGVTRDSFWPKTVLVWLVLSVIFILVSAQFVSPTRRWHFRRGRRSDPEVAP